MKYWLVFLSILNPFFLLSQQNTFLKVYYQLYSSRGWDVQQTSGNGFILGGDSSGMGYVIKTDEQGNSLWSKSYTTDPISIKQITDGGYIATGGTCFNGNCPATCIYKTNSTGDTLWTKILYGMGGQNSGKDIIQTSDGKYMETGAVLMSGVNITKIDTDGTILWTSFYGITTDDGGKKIIETADKGFVVLGSSAWSLITKIFIFKIDSTGNEKWKRYAGDIVPALANDMTQTSDGGYIITGRKPNSTGNDSQMYIIKTDSDGWTQWTKTYGNPDTNIYSAEMGMSIVQCADSSFMVLYNQQTSDSSQVYLMKLSSNGDSLWSKKILNSGDGRALIRTNDNGFAITGGYYDYTVPPYSDNIFLLKTDSLGDYINSVPLLYSKSKEIAVLYPNPFNATAKLSFSNLSRNLFHLDIYDIIGQCVMSIETNDDNIILRKNNLKEGIYFFRINNESLHYSGKFVVK